MRLYYFAKIHFQPWWDSNPRPSGLYYPCSTRGKMDVSLGKLWIFFLHNTFSRVFLLNNLIPKHYNLFLYFYIPIFLFHVFHKCYMVHITLRAEGFFWPSMGLAISQTDRKQTSARRIGPHILSNPLQYSPYVSNFTKLWKHFPQPNMIDIWRQFFLWS